MRLPLALLWASSAFAQVSVTLTFADAVPVSRVDDATLAAGAATIRVPVGRFAWQTKESRPCLELQTSVEMLWNDWAYGVAFAPTCVNYVGVARLYTVAGELRLGWTDAQPPPACTCPVEALDQFPEGSVPLGTWTATSGAWSSDGWDGIGAGPVVVAIEDSTSSLSVTLSTSR